MRRCCGDAALADDLAQQAFLQAWRKISRLKEPDRFGAWLKRLAINVWLQHARRHDVLEGAIEVEGSSSPKLSTRDLTATGLDLDRALATLPVHVRACIVLSYHEGMTHDEISELLTLPLGTVKSHIRRGAERLRELLSVYDESGGEV